MTFGVDNPYTELHKNLFRNCRDEICETDR